MLVSPLIRQVGYATIIGMTFAVGHSVVAFAVDAANPNHAPPDEKVFCEPETRAAMDALRRRVINVHSLITHRRMPVAAAAQFAREAEADVARIKAVRAVSDLNPDPMTVILRKIEVGAAAIAHPTPERGQVDGLVDVVSALEEYGTAFDHPGWRRIQQQ